MTRSTPSSTRGLLAVLAIAVLGALALAACGGSSSDSTGSSAASSDAGSSSAIGGGTAMCDQATFDTWVEAWGESQGGTATLPANGFTCADGWAVLDPTLDSGGGGIDTVVIVQAEGPNWALMDRGKVCGTSEADATIPSSLYQAGCTTS